MIHDLGFWVLYTIHDRPMQTSTLRLVQQWLPVLRRRQEISHAKNSCLSQNRIGFYGFLIRCSTVHQLAWLQWRTVFCGFSVGFGMVSCWRWLKLPVRWWVCPKLWHEWKQTVLALPEVWPTKAWVMSHGRLVVHTNRCSCGSHGSR